MLHTWDHRNPIVPEVCLVPVNESNLAECLALQVQESQASFVAGNAKSLAEASVKANYYPLAIYDRAALGFEKPNVPMLGFAMYEVTAGVGFLLRLMIDRSHQGQGYGRAAVTEIIRRLGLHPDVQMIATSHRRENTVAGKLFRELGFVDWDIEWAAENPDEVFLMLPED